jgi:hypothetical protein
MATMRFDERERIIASRLAVGLSVEEARAEADRLLGTQPTTAESARLRDSPVFRAGAVLDQMSARERGDLGLIDDSRVYTEPPNGYALALAERRAQEAAGVRR